MSQKRKAYRDTKKAILNRLCVSYETATSKEGLDLIRQESKTRIQNKSLIRLLDIIYTEMAILTTKAEIDLRKIVKELTRPYILRVTVGYGIGEAGRRYDICKVKQVRNRKVAQPLNTHNRSGYYHKSSRQLIQDYFVDGWDRECHLCIYHTNDFTFSEGILYD